MPEKNERSREEMEGYIECPMCGCRRHYVIYTRHVCGRTRRRRQCAHCGRRFTTIERVN